MSSSTLRTERARFIDEVNTLRASRGRRRLRRHVLSLYVVEAGFTQLPWFAAVAVEMPRRSRWEFDGIMEYPWLEANALATARMLQRLGGGWVMDTKHDPSAEREVPHFGCPTGRGGRLVACVPAWLPLIRGALPAAQRGPAIRAAMSNPTKLAALETTMRLARSPGQIRSFIKTMVAETAGP